VWRASLIATVLALVAWLLVNLLVTTDLDRVENELVRLVEVARKGGPDAAADILAAFAEDYRGDGAYARDNVERALQRYVATSRVERLDVNNFKTVWAGEEIVVPLLLVTGAAAGFDVRLAVAVTWGERDGSWKIVDITRFQLQ